MTREDRKLVRLSQPLSILTCTDKLLENDPKFVELSLERLGEHFDLGSFSAAIRANRTVRHVCFSGTFVRELEERQWRTLLEVVGFLEALEELQIWCSTIPVDSLLQTIRNARLLKKVYFFRVSLSGNQEQFDGLAKVVRKHQELVDFRLGGFTLVQDVVLDPVVEALAETPQLKVLNLQLSGGPGQAPFSSQALSKLMMSETIQDLYLSRLGLSNDHIAVIALSLLRNETLRTLDLFGNTIENAHIILIANSLQTNPSLQTLVLPCPHNDLSVTSCAAISRALQLNKALVTLNLPRTNLSDDALQSISEGLIVNTTLKKIEVGVSEDVGAKGVEALTKVLEQNYELERLVVASSEKSIKDKVNYFMRLNEVGRGRLFRDDTGQASREQWVDMLISCSEDLDCLFYFITMNPSLCQYANSGKGDVIVTEEFRPSRRHTIDCLAALELDAPKDRVEHRRASAF